MHFKACLLNATNFEFTKVIDNVKYLAVRHNPLGAYSVYRVNDEVRVLLGTAHVESQAVELMQADATSDVE